MNIKLIIADENKSSRELIKFKIETAFENQLQLVAACSNPTETIGSVFIHQPDILILDIKMFDHHHLDSIERLLSLNPNNLKIVIIATENQMPLIKRIVEIGIAGLLTKPVSTDDLKKILTRIISRYAGNNKKELLADQFITLKSSRSKILISQNDIIFIESQRNICRVTFHDGTEKTVNESMSSVENRLSIKDLVRIDKSTILNISKIIYLDSDVYNKCCKLRLVTGEEITKSLSKTGVERLYKMTANA